MTKTEWGIKDEENNTHIIRIVSKKKNVYDLYIDDFLLNEIKMTVFFNSEYFFEAFGKKCSIVKMMDNKMPTLVVDNEYQDDTSKKYFPIPKPNWFTYSVIAINILAFLAVIVFLFIRLDDYYLIGMHCIGSVCILLPMTIGVEFVSTLPLTIKNPKFRKIYRVFLVLIVEFFFTFGIYIIVT